MTPITRPHGWGVSIPPQLVRQHGAWIADQELALLQPATWHNWNVEPVTATATDARFIPLVWSAGMLRKAQAELLGRPNTTWLLWNEPDRADQANMTPVQAYTATLAFLRAAWDLGIGYEFQWAAPGVWIDAQDGLDWATEYIKLLRRHGISRPSYWHIHSYRSVSKGHFARGWAEWQAWYAAWGLGAPVVLSEACAEGADYDTQRGMMDECRALLDRGEVAGVYWYAAHTYGDVWPSSSLCAVDLAEREVALTRLGAHWTSLR